MLLLETVHSGAFIRAGWGHMKANPIVILSGSVTGLAAS